VPDFDVLKTWYAKQDEERKDAPSEEEMCADERVRKLCLDSMNELAIANKLNGLERIKKIYLHSEPFSEKNDLMTPSQKLKRNVSAQRFRQQIDDMYQS